MKLVTGDVGLDAIDKGRGTASVGFALHPKSKYPPTPGPRLAKTYAQLLAGPRTGRALYAELEREDWQLPRARRRFGRAEFDYYLRHLVGNEQLHVVVFSRLTPQAALGLRSDLKATLTRVVNGCTDVAPLLNEIERVAKYTAGSDKATLGNAGDAMRKLVELFAPNAMNDVGLGGMSWDRLYHEVRNARNEIAHTGTEAVLTATRTTALASVLLEALLVIAGDDGVTKFRDVMVANPVCVHGWQTVADVRRTMLATDFSELPFGVGLSGETWKMVTAENVAAYLATDRDAKLGRTLAEATDERPCPLRLGYATTADVDMPVGDIWDPSVVTAKPPLIVTREVDKKRVAVGILTWFDLL